MNPQAPADNSESPAVELKLEARAIALGHLPVGRVLPSTRLRSVGPFLFLDHLGPVQFEPGNGLAVQPHPHIGLCTLTYLFDGEIDHRDSLGYFQPIRPREVNWMQAGRGIVHSERTSQERIREGSSLHGVQFWVGLPLADQETAPSFTHCSARDIPETQLGNISLRVVCGKLFGMTSPVPTPWPLFCVDVLFHDAAGSEPLSPILQTATDLSASAAAPHTAALEIPTQYSERAVYVVSGSVRCADSDAHRGELLVLRSGVNAQLSAAPGSRVVLFGGEPLDGPQRRLWWNFAYTDAARLEQAKQDWREGRFAKVVGDEREFVPLPAS